MFINRNWERTEADDFKLNVAPGLGEQLEAVPVKVPDPTAENGYLVVGWNIIWRFE